jgi:cytoskeletal protein CcmA (bactofilin family)
MSATPPAVPPAASVPGPAAAAPIPPALEMSGPPIVVTQAPDLAETGTVLHSSVKARRWSVRGTARVLGGVEADSVRLEGVASIGGAMTVRDLEILGSLDVFGETKVKERTTIRGTARFHAPLFSSRVTAAGELEVNGSLTTPVRLEVQRSLVVRGPLQAGRVQFDGAVDLRGPVVAGEFDGLLRGNSTAETLRCDRISIRVAGRRLPRIPLLPPRSGPELIVRRIEAREAALENVRAEQVRVDRLTVGPGCHLIDVMGEIVSRHPSAHVGPEAEVSPPHGLTP